MNDWKKRMEEVSEAVITVSVNSRFHYTISWMIQFDPIRSDRKNEAMNYICNYALAGWMIDSIKVDKSLKVLGWKLRSQVVTRTYLA